MEDFTDPRALYDLLPPDARDAIYELLLTDPRGRLQLHLHEGFAVAVTFTKHGKPPLRLIWLSNELSNHELAF